MPEQHAAREVARAPGAASDSWVNWEASEITGSRSLTDAAERDRRAHTAATRTRACSTRTRAAIVIAIGFPCHSYQRLMQRRTARFIRDTHIVRNYHSINPTKGVKRPSEPGKRNVS